LISWVLERFKFRGGNEVGTINRRFSGATRGGEGQVRDKRTGDAVHTAQNRHGNLTERMCRPTMRGNRRKAVNTPLELTYRELDCMRHSDVPRSTDGIRNLSGCGGEGLTGWGAAGRRGREGGGTGSTRRGCAVGAPPREPGGGSWDGDHLGSGGQKGG